MDNEEVFEGDDEEGADQTTREQRILTDDVLAIYSPLLAAQIALPQARFSACYAECSEFFQRMKICHAGLFIFLALRKTTEF